MSSSSLILPGQNFQAAYPSISTSKQHNKKKLAEIFYSEKTLPSTLGRIFVESAPRSGKGRLDVMLNSTGFGCISPDDLDRGVRAAAIAESFASVRQILCSNRSYEISSIALSYVLAACAPKFRSTDSRSLIHRVFELPNSKDIDASALSMLFEACVRDADIHHSVNILEKVFKREKAKDIPLEKVQAIFNGVLGPKDFGPNLSKVLGLMMSSPIADKISDDDLSALYEKAIVSKNSELAATLHEYTRNKCYTGNSHAGELYFYILFNKAEEFEGDLKYHLRTLPPDEIAKVFYKMCCVVPSSPSEKIIRLFIDALKEHSEMLSNLAKKYLTVAFWYAVTANIEPLKAISLQSFVAKLIDPSDLNKLDKVCGQRHQKARQELEVEVGLNLCGGPTLWLYSPV